MFRTAALPAAPETDIDSINLRRLLLRLEQQILVPSSDSQLLHSSFERDRVAQNLEYARTLLLRLQHNAPNVKSQARKNAQQAELVRHRALIKRMTEKLYEMRRQDDVVLVSGSSEVDEEEDLLSKYFAPEPVQATANISRDLDAGNKAAATSTTLPNSLRSRPTKTSSTGSAMPTKAPSTALPAELFGSGGKSAKLRGMTEEISHEKQLEYQDSTQAELTSSLISLAKQLKASSLAFQEDLALDSETVGRTESSLGRNQSGLEAASRGMGVLRKMSEGRWWWERYIMFILIAVLWIAELALVFIGPKIRL